MFSKLYEEIGGFDYEKYKIDEDDFGLCKPEDREFKVIKDHHSWYYEGEVLKGTSIRHGRGLLIMYPVLMEGYWKNNKRHGRVLTISLSGVYDISEWLDEK